MAQEIGVREVLQQVDARIDSLGGAVAELRGEMRELRGEMYTNFRWMVGLLFTAWVTIMASVLGLGLAILFRLP